MDNINILQEKINTLKQKLYLLLEHEDKTNSPSLLEISQELDKLINMYYCCKKIS